MAIKKVLTPEELLKQQLSQVAAPTNRMADYYKPVQGVAPPAPTAENGYTPSSSVNQAYDYYAQTVKNQPGQYVNNWQDQLDTLYNQIAQRPSFNYDLNGDMLYQQYKDQYQQAGQKAMMDTQGQAAALTGGYGSTFGVQAGQQAYDSYLQQLNNIVPQLEQNAYNRYQGEGADLYNLYGVTQQNENIDYSRYQDAMGNFQADRGFAAEQYGLERAFDYGTFADKRSFDFQNEQFDWQKDTDARDYQFKQEQFAYQQKLDAAQQNFQQAQFEWQKATDARDYQAAEYWKGQQMAYQREMDTAAQAMEQAKFEYAKQADATAQSNWNAQFDYAKQQDAQAYALENPAPVASTSSSGKVQFNSGTLSAAASAVKSGGNAGLQAYVASRVSAGMSAKAGADLYNRFKAAEVKKYGGGGR